MVRHQALLYVLRTPSSTKASSVSMPPLPPFTDALFSAAACTHILQPLTSQIPPLLVNMRLESSVQICRLNGGAPVGMTGFLAYLPLVARSRSRSLALSLSLSLSRSRPCSRSCPRSLALTLTLSLSRYPFTLSLFLLESLTLTMLIIMITLLDHAFGLVGTKVDIEVTQSSFTKVNPES